jgi:hypothetical protein
VSDNAAQHEQSYFQHTFCRPGVYRVHARATDSEGQSHTFRLAVHVFPPLRPWILLARDRLIARFSGGDHIALYMEWSTPAGRYWTRTIRIPPDGPVALRIVDGTGTAATVGGRMVAGHLSDVRGLPSATAPFAGGPFSPSSC